jgi:hypothetical protein
VCTSPSCWPSLSPPPVHYSDRHALPPGATVGIYDLGGDTFDATIVRRGDDGFEIVGRPQGDDHLGGVDLDAPVWDHVVGVVGRPHTEPGRRPLAGPVAGAGAGAGSSGRRQGGAVTRPRITVRPADSNPNDTDATADSTFRIISGYADCVASVGEPGGICTDLDGDGQAGYPDSG